jgi:hypothetical protein
MEHPLADFHVELRYRNAKSPASAEAGLLIDDFKRSSGSEIGTLTRFLDANRDPPPDQVRGHASLEDAIDQPRVRERIMKLSKVYSATCHHRYWSER